VVTESPVKSLDALWQPLELGPTTVPNRVVVTATTLLYGQDGILSDRHIAYYRERARGGAGLQITEEHAAHPLSTGPLANHCSAWDERCVPQLRKLGEAVREHGGRQFVQLFAAGVSDSGTMTLDWYPLWAPSHRPHVGFNEQGLTMGQAEIDDLIAGFARSAANAQAAGLDGIEIHGAHGWLIGQFLNPIYNERCDQYGGSVENRCRLALEIGEAVRRAVEDRLTVGIRLSMSDHVAGGITPDLVAQQLELFSDAGLFDYFSLSDGGTHAGHRTIPTMELPGGHLAGFGRRAKGIVGDRARIFIAGRIRDPRIAARLVEEGAADMVAMTRAHLADPHLVRKAREGRDDEIVPCIGENDCIVRAHASRPVACMMNPVSGREREWGTEPHRNAGPPHRVLVAGGGPAGLKAAATLARRGHHVVLFEREDELGGHLNLLKRLPYRRDWELAVDALARAAKRTGVEVRIGTEASAALAHEEAADAVVCATGAAWERTGYSVLRPDRPGIPGIADGPVLDIADAVRRAVIDPTALGRRVLLLDSTGDYLPLGLADLLSSEGVEVEFISPRLYVGEIAVASLDAGFVFPRLASAGVRFTPQHFVEAIDGGRVELADVWGGPARSIEVDTIVLSLLRVPNDGLARELDGLVPQVVRIGDALAPRRTADAIYEGEKIGRALFV
jgi:2,4-dienoyl-CoA reductase-like NADH-dependent reductase (Old Yellow Enzyme family)